MKKYKSNRVNILNKLAKLQYNRLNQNDFNNLSPMAIFNSDIQETIYNCIDKIV